MKNSQQGNLTVSDGKDTSSLDGVGDAERGGVRVRWYYRHQLGVSYTDAFAGLRYRGARNGEIPDATHKCEVLVSAATVKFESGFVPAQQLTALISEAVSKVPKTYLGSAEVEVCSGYSYDDEREPAELEVRYSRPETDQEFAWRRAAFEGAARIARMAAEKKRLAAEERDAAEYKRLKAKFG
jgi:hypothetical protein